MCAERIQRLLMAFMLSIALYLFLIDSMYGYFLQVFIIGMILVWALTGFCPSIWFLRRVTTKCED